MACIEGLVNLRLLLEANKIRMGGLIELADSQPKLDSYTPKQENRQVHLKLAAPLHIWRNRFCKTCNDYDFCKVNFEHHLLCILSKIALETAWKNRLTEKINSHRL